MMKTRFALRIFSMSSTDALDYLRGRMAGIWHHDELPAVFLDCRDFGGQVTEFIRVLVVAAFHEEIGLEFLDCRERGAGFYELHDVAVGLQHLEALEVGEHGPTGSFFHEFIRRDRDDEEAGHSSGRIKEREVPRVQDVECAVAKGDGHGVPRSKIAR